MRDYVEELRVSDEKRGVTYRHTTWGPTGAVLDAQEKARLQLALGWMNDRGHTSKIRLIDRRPLWIRDDLVTGRKFIVIRQKWIVPWLLDRRDQFVSRLCKWRDQILRIRNPYLAPGEKL